MNFRKVIFSLHDLPDAASTQVFSHHLLVCQMHWHPPTTFPVDIVNKYPGLSQTLVKWHDRSVKNQVKQANI